MGRLEGMSIGTGLVFDFMGVARFDKVLFSYIQVFSGHRINIKQYLGSQGTKVGYNPIQRILWV